MEEQPPGDTSSAADLAAQLERAATDLHALAETIGAVPAGSALRVATRRQLIVSSVVTVILVVAVSWFILRHWHSLVALVAPLVWVVSHSIRWRRGRRPVLPGPRDEQGRVAE
jgi:hypothetical protein